MTTKGQGELKKRLEGIKNSSQGNSAIYVNLSDNPELLAKINAERITDGLGTWKEFVLLSLAGGVSHGLEVEIVKYLREKK